MTVRIIIAVRPVDDGKSRLAAALSPAQRTALNLRLFNHVLTVATASLPAAQCLVISRSADLLRRAANVGAQPVREEASSLNGALEQAAAVATADGASAILSLSTDLPMLDINDVRAMLDAVPRGGIAIAPDEGGSGTNALLLSPPALIPYRYGPGSFSAHSAAAHAAGITPVIVRRPGLAIDIDTPADLARIDLL